MNTNNIENKPRKKKTSTTASVKSKKPQRQQMSQFNSILIVVLSVIVVISIIAGVVTNVGEKTTAPKPEKPQAASGEANIDIVENNNDLQLNQYPEINELISNYRKAVLEGDSEALKTIYNSDQNINEDVLNATSQIIQEYNNTQYYTKRGINTGEYIVFVYDELKLADIKTAAPNLSIFYVRTNENNQLYIYRGEYNPASGAFKYDEEIQNYINTLYASDDVSQLISTVNTKMDSACANDSDLMEFMMKVRAKSNAQSTIVQNTTPETTAETDSETESESETETEEE